MKATITQAQFNEICNRIKEVRNDYRKYEWTEGMVIQSAIYDVSQDMYYDVDLMPLIREVHYSGTGIQELFDALSDRIS